MGFEFRKFKDINLSDSFFDSLKVDYAEFSEWFYKKSENNALIHFDGNGNLNGFLYLKEEDEVLDIEPPQGKLCRLKVGTMKIDAHGTRLGERFMKKIFDYALHKNSEEIYVTIFDKHKQLVKLFTEYNFNKIGIKSSKNGIEDVYSRKMKGNDIIPSYPFINFENNCNIYFLSIRPEYHSRLFPDSLLNTEDNRVVKDISHTNSIHKIYIGSMSGMEGLKKGDIVLIYRTAEAGKAARFSAVLTSACVIEEYSHINDYKNENDFFQYCRRYSTFNEAELKEFFNNKKYKHIIKMSYNIALTKRIVRDKLLDMGIMSDSSYSGFGILNYKQLIQIFNVSQTNESIIINQT